MKRTKKNGLIQTPILIATVVAVLVLVSIYFVVASEYKKYQADKIKEDSRVQVLADTQQKSLEQAMSEIEKLKTENIATKQSQQALEQKVRQDSNKQHALAIQASEIEPYLTGVVSIRCSSGRGTGSLWKVGEEYTVITNKHVMNASNRKTCSIDAINKEGTSDEGNYKVSDENFISGKNGLDFTSAKFYIDLSKFSIVSSLSKPVSDLNYKISALKKCPKEMAIGSPVAIIGFPATTEKQVELNGYSFSIVLRSVTEGIISAHDTTVSGGVFGNLQFVNYFVSAKLDSGNSGGIALSKDMNGLCVLGVPTWLSMGNYDTQGIIQNINNLIQ